MAAADPSAFAYPGGYSQVEADVAGPSATGHDGPNWGDELLRRPVSVAKPKPKVALTRPPIGAGTREARLRREEQERIARENEISRKCVDRGVAARTVPAG